MKTLFCVKLFGGNRKFGWKEIAERRKFSGLFTADIKEIMKNAIAELQKPGNVITKSNYVVLYEALEKAYQCK